MPYIGNQGSIAGFVNQPSKQDLTGATGGTLTLTHAVSGPEDISLFINNVRQEPTESYTVTNTTVTLQGYTVSATDDIYVLYNGLTQLSSVPVDGSVSTAKIADNAVTMDKLATSGTLPALDGSALTGINAGSEYFQVNLTTDQTGISSQSGVYVDFGGKGTVEHDTASNFDSSNDCYLLDSSNGVYIISYSLGVRSPTITTEILVCASAAINIATDGSTYSPYKGNAMQIRGDAGNDGGSVTFTNSFIYKATTATTKIKLAANATTVGSANWMIETQAGSMMQDTDSAVTAAHVTFMSVMRIA